MKISKKVLSMILTVGVIAGSSVTAMAANGISSADRLEDLTAVVESKDESRAVSFADEAENFITVSDEFRALVEKVTSIRYQQLLSVLVILLLRWIKMGWRKN